MRIESLGRKVGIAFDESLRFIEIEPAVAVPDLAQAKGRSVNGTPSWLAIYNIVGVLRGNLVFSFGEIGVS